MTTSRPGQDLPVPTGTGTVRAPGARLHWQARGAGPCLMMLCGGAADADGFSGVAPYLDTDYTVITYDRRGLSRSLLDDPTRDPAITIATHSEDVHRILAALGAAPALVFGSSIGAVIGLDLLIRHPEDVRVLIAHEPPIPALAADDDKAEPSLARIYERTGDADETIRRFAASLTRANLTALVSERRDSESRTRNNEFFLRNDAPAVGQYELDLDALKALASRLIVVGGRDGREFSPYASASRLATMLGTGMTEFPGNHAGFAIYPAEFARSMRRALRAVGTQAPCPAAPGSANIKDDNSKKREAPSAAAR